MSVHSIKKMSGYTKQDWNNGTIYRIMVQSKINDNFSPVIDVPIDIAQSELTGKVFIGVENFCLDRQLHNDAATSPAKLGTQNQTKIDNWSETLYLQLRSVSLPPDVDYTTDATTQVGKNTQIFARFPLPTEYIRESSTKHAMVPRVTGTFNLQKDGILYEMSNNPNAISNGRMRIEVISDANVLWNTTLAPIRKLFFTLVIYKPRNTYN